MRMCVCVYDFWERAAKDISLWMSPLTCEGFFWYVCVSFGRERRRIFQWEWKLRCVPRKLRHPANKIRFQFLKILPLTGLFLRKKYTYIYMCIYVIYMCTHIYIPSADSLDSLNNFWNGRSFQSWGVLKGGWSLSLTRLTYHRHNCMKKLLC